MQASSTPLQREVGAGRACIRPLNFTGDPYLESTWGAMPS